MKKLLPVISIICSFTFPSFAQSVIWNTPVPVASGTTYSNIYPRIALTTGDNPQVTWGNGGPDKIYSSRWNGSGFTSPIAINPAGTIPYLATWTGAEVAASGDTVFVVFSTDPTAGEAHVYTVRSLDGGVTFQDTVRADQIGTDVPRFPSVAVGMNGNPVVNFMRFNASMTDPEYAIARSVTGGASYLTPINPTASVTGFVCDCCPASVVTSGNRHVLLFRNDDNNIREMWGCYSTDGSASFTAASEVDQTNWLVNSCPSSGPSGVISGDSLITTWMSAGDVYISSASLSNQQIGVHRQLFPIGVGVQNFPVIAGKGDTLAVVWQGMNGSYTDVFFTYSVTGTAGLGVNIDTLTQSTSGAQSRPDIQFSNGKFHIVYSDNMGNNVMYLQGAIDPASLAVKQSELTEPVQIFAAQADGKTTLKVKSEWDTEASIQLINAAGQQVSSGNQQIVKGISVISVPEGIQKGIYYVVLETKEGRIYKQKVIL
ncbi:T9SS type A sorting domain-containing protein [Fluviicola sp.]|uniref:T9SS type A sorting domain-containing protein n=1 Tax=Fluviicola sp. TaxID=1917219 RepID=UPI0031DF7223